jgi:hypothetical protein
LKRWTDRPCWRPGLKLFFEGKDKLPSEIPPEAVTCVSSYDLERERLEFEKMKFEREQEEKKRMFEIEQAEKKRKECIKIQELELKRRELKLQEDRENREVEWKNTTAFKIKLFGDAF